MAEKKRVGFGDRKGSLAKYCTDRFPIRKNGTLTVTQNQCFRFLLSIHTNHSVLLVLYNLIPNEIIIGLIKLPLVMLLPVFV
jgi:hypothetical protein